MPQHRLCGNASDCGTTHYIKTRWYFIFCWHFQSWLFYVGHTRTTAIERRFPSPEPKQQPNKRNRETITHLRPQRGTAFTNQEWSQAPYLNKKTDLDERRCSSSKMYLTYPCRSISSTCILPNTFSLLFQATVHKWYGHMNFPEKFLLK